MILSDYENQLEMFFMKTRFKSIRESKGYTQTEIANRLGMTLGNYQKYEYGNHSSIRYKVITDFCKICDCTPNDIFELASV